MDSSDTYLYYPFIKIPERTLIHGLLFQDRVKRIIPSVSQMDSEQHEEALLPNAICRQYLGYDFIEDSDFWESRDEIESMFCRFIEDAYAEGSGSRFESILGEAYSDRFRFGNTTIIGGSQHFVYAEKFAPRVVETLKRFDWMRHDDRMHTCEMKSELCNVYMAVLACSISKRTGLPISTDVRFAEEMTRMPLFAEYFPSVIPDTQEGSPTHNFCLTLLLRSHENDFAEAPPLENILTFPEAVRIRAGLEEYRQGFRSIVDRLVAKATAVDTGSPEDFLKGEISDVVDAAREYQSSIHSVAAHEVAADRRNLIGKIQTGFSTLSPIAGAGIDLLNGTLGPGAVVGSALTVAAYVIPRQFNQNENRGPEPQLSDRQEAYLFMNRMWALRAARE